MGAERSPEGDMTSRARISGTYGLELAAGAAASSNHLPRGDALMSTPVRLTDEELDILFSLARPIAQEARQGS